MYPRNHVGSEFFGIRITECKTYSLDQQTSNNLQGTAQTLVNKGKKKFQEQILPLSIGDVTDGSV